MVFNSQMHTTNLSIDCARSLRNTPRTFLGNEFVSVNLS